MPSILLACSVLELSSCASETSIFPFKVIVSSTERSPFATETLAEPVIVTAEMLLLLEKRMVSPVSSPPFTVLFLISIVSRCPCTIPRVLSSATFDNLKVDGLSPMLINPLFSSFRRAFSDCPVTFRCLPSERMVPLFTMSA